MKSKLMNFDGAKALTKEEQKSIVGGGCGCGGGGGGTNPYYGGPPCHMC